jgi:hypothetical protein
VGDALSGDKRGKPMTTGMKSIVLRWLPLLAFATGLGVLVVTGIFASLKLASVEPLNSAYGDQAMLAFELARSPADLARVIGTNPPSANAITVRALAVFKPPRQLKR